MDNLREWVKANPIVAGGLVAIVALAGYVAWKQLAASGNATLHDTLTQIVTIRDKETGDEWEMPRGRMEQMLWDRPAPVNPNEGIVNPKTGKPNGFPISQWEETIKRINAERADMAAARPDPNEAKKKPDR